MTALRLHRLRFARWLGDMQVAPLSLVPAPDGSAIRDDVSGRTVTVAPANITEAEGMISAVKIAAAVEELLGKAQAVVEALDEEEANHGGLTSRATLSKIGALRLELSTWKAGT